MLSLRTCGEEYGLLVAADRLLHPDLLAQQFMDPISIDGQKLLASELSEDQSWLLDEALEPAAVLKLEDDDTGRWQLRDQSAFLEGSHRWLPCTVSRAEHLVAPRPGADRLRVNAGISAFTERRVVERLDSTLSLPSLSRTTRALLDLRSQPFANVQQLVSIIEKDVSLAARIVGWANSAYYAAPNSVDNIHDAIARVVGFDEALNLALGTGIGNAVPAVAPTVPGMPDYWTESLLTAATMENLATRLARWDCQPGTAYLAGLLSHFGTLLLAHVFAPQFAKIRELQHANRHLYYGYCDMEVLVLSRDVLAAELLQDWALPEDVVTAVRMQCAPPEHSPLAGLLNYTRCLLAAEGLGSYPWRSGAMLPAPVCGLDQEMVSEVLKLLRDSAGDGQRLSAFLVAANDDHYGTANE